MSLARNFNCVGNAIVVPRALVDFNDISMDRCVTTLPEAMFPTMPGERVITHDGGEHECDGRVVASSDPRIVRIRLDWETWR